MAWPEIHLSGACDRLRRYSAAAAGRAVLPVLAAALIAAVSCGAGPSGEEQQNGRVTVPDGISDLPSGEVERRLSGLIENGHQPGLSAPGTEPTPPPAPTVSIQDILDALNSGNGRGGAGEIIISVSPSMSQGLSSPGLRIKTPPEKGIAIILSESQVLYVPAPGTGGSDSFEYELMDGATPVFSAVVELRQPAIATSASPGDAP